MAVSPNISPEWVPKLELLACFLFIFHFMGNASKTGGWESFFSTLIAAAIFYWLISTIINRERRHVEILEKRFFNLERRFTTFICDASLGRVKNEDLKRLANATNLFTGRGREDDLSIDDFSLINRAWYFWKSGFDWQDSTECINCKNERKEHPKEGSCPK